MFDQAAKLKRDVDALDDGGVAARVRVRFAPVSISPFPVGYLVGYASRSSRSTA